jgi:hypothetical protein
MEYFAGLDISMKETHICVMDRDGKVALEAKAATSAAAIAVELAKAPTAQRIVFEQGSINHRGNKGGTRIGAESFLRERLPMRYAVTEGEVVDLHGHTSPQLKLHSAQ